MKISLEKLTAAAQSTGFRAEILEKVVHLLNLLEAFNSHPFLKNRIVLKGGTALNLFAFDVPRLSVDIDLNYIGAVDRSLMLEERPKVEQAVQAVLSREDFSIRRTPQDHAGGKWSLRYASALGAMGNLEVDLNFMFRVPLWTPTSTDSCKVGPWRAQGIPIFDLHELAAGKLAALFARKEARDLFDCHQILSLGKLDKKQLRVAFVAYGAMSRKDWRPLSPEDIYFDPQELAQQLIPTLRVGILKQNESPIEFGKRLLDQCKERLTMVLPFSEQEQEFLNILLDRGEIRPDLLTPDTILQGRIQKHPLLEWKAMNVRKHKGIYND